MVTLLSDCYISSHGKSPVSPVSYHYANDWQFNFSWSEREFLIRVRHSTQDGEKDVKARKEEGCNMMAYEVKKREGWRRRTIPPINICIRILLFSWHVGLLPPAFRIVFFSLPYLITFNNALPFEPIPRKGLIFRIL